MTIVRHKISATIFQDLMKWNKSSAAEVYFLLKLGQVFTLEKGRALAIPCFSVPITQGTALLPRHFKTRKGWGPCPSPIHKIYMQQVRELIRCRGCEFRFLKQWATSRQCVQVQQALLLRVPYSIRCCRASTSKLVDKAWKRKERLLLQRTWTGMRTVSDPIPSS